MVLGLFDYDHTQLIVKMTKYSWKWHLVTYNHKLDGCIIQDFFLIQENNVKFEELYFNY
jgi:hypothetical protein